MATVRLPIEVVLRDTFPFQGHYRNTKGVDRNERIAVAALGPRVRKM